MMERIIKEDKELKLYLKRIADGNKKRYVIMRGLLYGVFTALGATLGFTLVLLISSKLITNLKQIPIINNFLTETKLEVLIEKQLANINNSEKEGTSNEETISKYYLRYENAQFDIVFDYPASLTNLSEYITKTEDPELSS